MASLGCRELSGGPWAGQGTAGQGSGPAAAAAAAAAAARPPGMLDRAGHETR